MLRADPTDGFVGEPIEGVNCEFEVFDPGIFRGIVAKAGERLDEHHDGGDAGACYFGSIVERA